MRCLFCHYDLRNLSERRCPECGTTFDPNDPSTFDVPSLVAEITRSVAIGGITTFAIALFVLMTVVAMYGSNPNQEIAPAIIIALIAAICAVALSAITSTIRFRNRQKRDQQR